MKTISKNLKTTKIATISKTIVLSLLLGSIIACDKDDDAAPVNEEEVITTVRVTLTSSTNPNDVVTLLSKDTDADGPAQPTVTVSGQLQDNTTYNGKVTLLDETKNPADDITAEILSDEDEKKDHQFFFEKIESLLGTFSYADQDADGNPIGINFTFASGTPSQGKLLLTLRHEPNKSGAGVSAGDKTNAAGTTDVEASFPLVVQ
jgi:hypothetical protein